MEYSEDLISNILQQWKDHGYTDTVIVDHGMLFALNHRRGLQGRTVPDSQLNFYFLALFRVFI